nr:hypothetical protein BaRGS_015584 [Batillaria attramentaria]
MSSTPSTSFTPTVYLPPSPTLSAADNDSLARVQAATYGIYSFYMWFVFILGFPGNVASVVTVLSMTKLSTATLYVALLAVVDAVALVVKLVVHQIPWHGAPLYTWGCKASFIAGTISCYSNWVLVLVCFERFLAVCLPLKKAIFFTRSRAIMIASVLLGVVLVVHIHGFILYVSHPVTGRKCGWEMDLRWVKVWFWIAAFLYSFAPFILLVVFATLIIVGLRRYRAARKSILGNHTHNGGKGDKRGENSVERAISIMLVVAAVVFLVLTLPTCVFLIAYDGYGHYEPLEKARWELFREISLFLADLNHAVNFYLYFMTADKFRSQFRRLVMCGRDKERKKSDATSLAVTQYSIANSTENIHQASSRV